MHGGGVMGRPYRCSGVGGIDVGEQFMRARSASWSASDGEGASKEKSRKSAMMAVVAVVAVLSPSGGLGVVVGCPGRSSSVGGSAALPYSRVRAAMVIRRVRMQPRGRSVHPRIWLNNGYDGPCGGGMASIGYPSRLTR